MCNALRLVCSLALAICGLVLFSCSRQDSNAPTIDVRAAALQTAAKNSVPGTSVVALWRAPEEATSDASHSLKMQSVPARRWPGTLAVADPAGLAAPVISIDRQSDNPAATSTMVMADRLRNVSAKLNLDEMSFRLNDRRVDLIRKRLVDSRTTAEHIRLEWTLANELLNDGQNAKCLSTLDDLEKFVSRQGISVNRVDRIQFRTLRILANLRTGELDNCCALHNADSCLLPLKGGAIYSKTTGPENAIVLLMGQLNVSPGDLTAAGC